MNAMDISGWYSVIFGASGDWETKKREGELPLVWFDRSLLRQGVQAFHQAALAAGGVVLMNDALGSSRIE